MVWTGYYYANRDLAGPVVYTSTHISLNIQFDGPPAEVSNLPKDNFSATWTRFQTFPTFDNYIFEIVADDGVRLYVIDDKGNSTVVINEWRVGPRRKMYGNLTLRPGSVYTLQVDYFDYNGSSHMWVGWDRGYQGWEARYYNSINMDGDVAYIRDDKNADPNTALYVAWSDSPAPGVNADYFSVDWERTVYFPCTCTYRFNAAYDDGMRVYVDGQLLFDQLSPNNGPRSPVDRYLRQGKHFVEVQYVEYVGPASVQLTWQPLNYVSTAVPRELDP
jgi:hypothetical protein